jgi:hypothetical protein
MKEKKQIAVIVDGKKYEYLKSKHDGATKTCEDCALREMCNDYEDGIICGAFGIDSDSSSNFQYVGEEIPADEPNWNFKRITEKQSYDDYQERSTTANDRGEQLAWAFIIMLTGMLIANHGYLEYYVGAACGLAYLLLSMLQSAWQTIAIWIIKNRIKRDNLTIEDYPEWVGGWAWVFWYLKIGLLAIGTIYVAWRFISPLFNL